MNVTGAERITIADFTTNFVERDLVSAGCGRDIWTLVIAGRVLAIGIDRERVSDKMLFVNSVYLKDDGAVHPMSILHMRTTYDSTHACFPCGIMNLTTTELMRHLALHKMYELAYKADKMTDAEKRIIEARQAYAAMFLNAERDRMLRPKRLP